MSELMRFLAENSSRSTARFNPFSVARKTQFNTGGGGLSDPFIRPSGTFADPRLPGGGGVRFNPFRPGGRFGSDPTFGRSGGPFDAGGGYGSDPSDPRLSEGFGHGPQPDPGPPPIPTRPVRDENFGHGPQPDPGPPPVPTPPGGGGGGDTGGRVGQHPIGGFILPSGEHIPRENILVYDDGSRDWWDTLGNLHHDPVGWNYPQPIGPTVYDPSGRGSSSEGPTGSGGRRGEGFFGRGGTAVDPRLSEGFGHGPQPDPGPPILPTPPPSGGGVPTNPFNPGNYPNVRPNNSPPLDYNGNPIDMRYYTNLKRLQDSGLRVQDTPGFDQQYFNMSPDFASWLANLGNVIPTKEEFYSRVGSNNPPNVVYNPFALTAKR